MKKIYGILIALFFKSGFLFSQVSSFPYNEGFEATFTQGTPAEFLPDGNGNEVASTNRIFRDGVNFRTGPGALAVIPISSFSGTIILSLDFLLLPERTLAFGRAVQQTEPAHALPL